MTDYNGWTNYATWRVHLEIFDGIDPREMDWHRLDKFDLTDCLEEYVEEILDAQCRGGPATILYSYAMAFLSDVNWQEIALHMIDAYADETETEEA